MTTTAEIVPVLIPTSGVSSYATGISSDGTVIGYETSTATGTPVQHAFMVTNGTVTLLSPSPSLAYGINSYDEVVGMAANVGTEWFYGLVSTNISSSAKSTAGFAINDSGMIGGNGGATSSQGFVISNGTVTWLNTVDTAAVSSAVYGLNNGGVAVGYLQTSLTSPSAAYYWQNGTVTVLPSLSAGADAAAAAINGAGLIVGWSGGHAVEWQNGTVTDLGILSGYQSAAAYAVNDNGQIVGVTYDSKVNHYATLWDHGSIIDLNSMLPANSGWVLESATGINDQGLIVGVGSCNGIQTAFEMSLDGNAAPITTALAVVQLYRSGQLNHAQTVNDTAANVGTYLDSLSAMAAVGDLTAINLTDSGTPTLTITPGQLVGDAEALAKIAGPYAFQIMATDANLTFTAPSGHATSVLFSNPINEYQITALANGGGFSVVDTGTGRSSTDTLTNVTSLTFSDGATVYGGTTGAITLRSLGTLPAGTIQPNSSDSSGNVVGYAGSSSSPASATAFLWSQGAMTTLQPMSGASGAEAFRVTDTGLIVGQSYASNGIGTGSSTAVYWDLSAAQQGHTQPTSIGWLSGDFASVALSANNNGQIVGSSYSTSTTYHGFLWQNGSMISLGSLGGSQIEPLSINDNGMVVGKASLSGGNFHAFSWQNGVMTDLGTLSGDTTSAALEVNQSGIAAGYASNGGAPYQAVYWSNGQIHQLPNLPSFTSCFANAINDKGWMVGSSSNSSVAAAVLWANGTIYNLNNLLPSGSAWRLGDAVSVNDNGQITGLGTYNGHSATFVLNLPSILPLSAAAALTDQTSGLLTGPVAITDSALDISLDLGSLQSLAAGGNLASITLTDSGTPNLSITAAQLSADGAALNAITGNYTLTVTAGSASATIAGIAGHATTVLFTGDSSQYSMTSSNGVLTVTGNGVTDHLSGVSALRFNDLTEIVAATPGSASAVTTGNVTELYSAVLAREPDVGGLTFYQTYLAKNPSTPLLQFAEWFLTSAEYTAAHTYAQTTAGETQFIDDSYQNLLHRAPSADEVNFYLTKVLNQPGSQLQNHAQMLVYFSASTEFLSDVQITAANPASAQHWLLIA